MDDAGAIFIFVYYRVHGRWTWGHCTRKKHACADDVDDKSGECVR